MGWNRARTAAVAVCAMVATVTSAGTSAASTRSATVGHICDGSDRGIAKFVIISNGIPSGSNWTVSESYVDWASLQAYPDSALIQTTRMSAGQLSLTALATIPAGTVVKVKPDYISIPQGGSTTVTLSGYGGSDTLTFGPSGSTC